MLLVQTGASLIDNVRNAPFFKTPQWGGAKPLYPGAVEIEEPAVQARLSGEAIFAGELSARAPEGFKPPHFSQAELRVLEYDIKIIQQMKTQRLAGESTGDNLKDLALAYESVQNAENGHSERHSRFIEDAFSNISRMFFSQAARTQQNAADNLSAQIESPLSAKERADIYNTAVNEAYRQSDIFTNSFLANCKKLGLEGAFALAVSQLSD